MSPVRKLNAAWIQATSTEPRSLVNREEQLEDLVGRLDEFRQAKIREGHFLITGARGIGKSIFTRAALARFAKASSQAICITIDARGLGYRSFLQRFAESLARELIARATQGKRDEISLWAQQLLLLAKNPQISRSLAQTMDKNALLRGAPALGASASEEALSSDEIDMLVRFNVLLPRVRFQPELGYRAQPVLDLLRPSIQQKL